jgi:hypothetical protein
MCSAHDNHVAGKYENKAPFPSDIVPADRENMTGKQVREHMEAERARRELEHATWRAGDLATRRLLQADLEKEHGITGNPKAEKLWSLAWAHGHSAGYLDVISHYEELVELVK